MVRLFRCFTDMVWCGTFVGSRLSDRAAGLSAQGLRLTDLL